MTLLEVVFRLRKLGMRTPPMTVTDALSGRCIRSETLFERNSNVDRISVT